MVEMKEITSITKRETGTIIADYEKVDKDSMEVTIDDLRENLNAFELELTEIDDEIKNIDDSIKDFETDKNLLIEKKNGLDRSIKQLQTFLESYAVEEEGSDDGTEEEQPVEGESELDINQPPQI